MRSEGYCSCPVCMYVCVYVCVYVCPFIPAALHIRIAKEILPPYTLESQKRYQRILRNTGIVLNFADFPKNYSFKSYGVICLPRAALASLRFFPHEISFYAGLKPIATFSLHRQRAFGTDS